MKATTPFFLILSLTIFSACGLFRGTPPGTVEVEDQDWYMDRGEVRNIEWAEYLYWLQQEFSPEAEVYLQALPDREVWESVYDTRGRDFTDVRVFSQQNHRGFPVVGVSYEQARHYCHWRGNRVRQATGHNVIYELPSPEMYAKVVELYGFRDIGQTDGIMPRNELPVTPNGNISGLCVNVSEMTQTEGTAVGGNWTSPASDCPETRKYEKPENWLGFRCVARER